MSMAPLERRGEEHCESHPEAPTVGSCRKCGRFICAACTQQRESGVYCSECASTLYRHAHSTPAVTWISPRSFMSLLLSVVGCPLVPLGFVGALLGAWELLRIHQRKAPRDGWFLALLGLVLGCLSGPVLLWLLLFHMAG